MFVNVALDLPLYSTYTYSVPAHLTDAALPGKRVVVSFGKRTVTGIIVERTTSSSISKVLPIKFIQDAEPVISEELMKFCKWIADYYIAPPGEVLFSCVPRKAGVRSVERYELATDAVSRLSKAGFRSEVYKTIINTLADSTKALSKRQIEMRTGLHNTGSYLKNLEKKGIIKPALNYELPSQEKTVSMFRLIIPLEECEEILKKEKLRSPRYKSAINYLSTHGEKSRPDVVMETGLTSQQLLRLESLGIVSHASKRLMREHESSYDELQPVIELNAHQKFALDEITSSIDDGKFRQFLLHGITGSGKTEVYIKAAMKCIENGKTAIVMVPEISLTPQLVHRFRRVFGSKIGTIHSKLSEGERLDTFDRIVSGEIRIVIGARSALFAPIKNIGLVVIDEEHDSSYKQDSSPRYNGRDAGVYRASLNDAVVILGSATPSMESYHNAMTGKYKLIHLPERVSESILPEIRIVDLMDRESFDDEEGIDFLKSLERSRVKFLSKDLIFEIGKRIMSGESVIILQNRRGYYSYLECRRCGNVEMCERCNIALAYHKSTGRMMCHYCGYMRHYSELCTKCHSPSVTPKGAGTERVEEELRKLFPQAVIVRMDSDSLHSAGKYEKILKDFYDGKINVLTGTQIISKGLDFPNVTLVGVINADIGLLNPDFRSTEKTFQILTQVSGRSGRSSKKGEVLIQTNHADYFVFDSVKKHDYKGFYEREIKMRKELMYPPFSRIALVELRSEDHSASASGAAQAFREIKDLDRKGRVKIFPPVQPLFSKLRDQHRYHIMTKSPKESDPSGSYLASVLRQARERLSTSLPKSVRLTIDMDAVNLM